MLQRIRSWFASRDLSHTAGVKLDALASARVLRDEALEAYRRAAIRRDTRDMRRTRQIAIRATVDVLRLENAR